MSESDGSDVSVSLNIYEENLNEETVLDLSSQGLDSAPKIKNDLLCVLYLQNNKLRTLPDDFFLALPNLMWLDLRDNQLTDIPTSIKNSCLTHLLLQNNRLTSLPNELCTLVNLKVLQTNGNPLMYPPREVINAGLREILKFLHDKYFDQIFAKSQSDASISEDAVSTKEEVHDVYSQEGRSYNSVIDRYNIKSNNLLVQCCGKELADSEDEAYYQKIKGKCPKLSKSRSKAVPKYTQSSKYLKTLYADSKKSQDEKIKQSYLKDLAIKKHKNLLARRDKILQDRKNIELLKTWRKDYHTCQLFNPNAGYKLNANNYPYDTNPDFMALLSREDLEKDLPDKYKRRLVRRARASVPRKSNNDVHLAMKIKQLFENLEAIDLNREGLTPRTEQKVLLTEIQKISEIKQKLMELSTTNMTCVSGD